MENEGRPTQKKKIVILGGGPNRIGQGIEFDYCCVHAVQALREDGWETIMVNCNPETVSTDYDTSDRLYFEPLTREDVLEIIDAEKPEGVIVQFGGQTPLRLAVPLMNAGVKLLGTSADAIDRAEDRRRFGELLKKLGLRAPAWGTAHGLDEAREIAERIGYPVMVRPSYVLGGRAMEIVYEPSGLAQFVLTAMEASRRESLASRQGEEDAPILIDQFLPDAIEVDVDVVADGHGRRGRRRDGAHRGGRHPFGRLRLLPAAAFAVSRDRRGDQDPGPRAGARAGRARPDERPVRRAAPRRAGGIFILEVNPRASRTVPFVSKVTGVPLAKVAARIAAGKTLREMGIKEVTPKHVAVKEAVFPFAKFAGVDTILGPEMRSTGEVMGIAATFATAFGKSQIGAGTRLPTSGTAFLSVQDSDKAGTVQVAKGLIDLGFEVVATVGTHTFLTSKGLDVKRVNKVREGRPHIVDRLLDGGIHLVINTTSGAEAIKDSFPIRRNALLKGIPYYTTLSAARAAVGAIADLRAGKTTVRSLQEYQNG